MEHSRTSGRESYRHVLLAGIRRFLPAVLFSVGSDKGNQRWTDGFLMVGAALMGWTGESTLKDRFASVRDALVEMFFHARRPGQTPEGFFEAMDRRGGALLEEVGGHLRRQVEEVARRLGCWYREGFLAFAVDGTRVEAPRTRANQGEFGCAGREKTGPQLQLTALRHLGSGLLWDWLVGPGVEAERTHIRRMLAALPLGALLVADAGFTGYELMREILAGGRHLLIRVGSNVSLLQELGYMPCEGAETVYLWPKEARAAGGPPLALRLICLREDGENVWLLTDLSAAELTLKQARGLYRSRWGLEVGFRTLKQTMGHRNMLSRSPERAMRELRGAVVGQALMEMMGVEAQKDAQSLSPAGVQRLLRTALRRAWAPCRRDWLGRLLAQATKDTYRRHGSKTARDYPRKKQQKPPGAPKLRKADPSEVQQAQEVRKRMVDKILVA